MTKQKPKRAAVPARKFTGQRFEVAILERLERIAKLRHSSVRAVLEEIAEAGLPALEASYGIAPPVPAPAKPGPGSARKPARPLPPAP